MADTIKNANSDFLDRSPGPIREPDGLGCPNRIGVDLSLRRDLSIYIVEQKLPLPPRPTRRLRLLSVAMAGHGGIRATARTLLLILVCLLAALSGLQIPLRYHAGTRTNSTPDRSRYRPGAAIAIDLGNTNSCVAGYGPGGKMDETLFRFCIPSWIAFADDGTALVGEDAKNHADAAPRPPSSVSSACSG